MDEHRSRGPNPPWRYPRFTPRLPEGARQSAARVEVPLGLGERGRWDPDQEYLGEPEDPIEPTVRDVIAAGVRDAWEMEQVHPLQDPDDDDGPILRALMWERQGRRPEALALLRELIAADRRCLDAYSHLGGLAIDYSPGLALECFARGVAIGELSLPEGFDGVLPWGWIDNRPFLRCLHGYGLCLWRSGRREQAVEVFEALIWLSPGDNLGVRYLVEDVRAGADWDPDEEERGREALIRQLGPALDQPAARPSPEQAREDFAPLLWLLEHAAGGGLPLTQTGALARVIVRRIVERFPEWWQSPLSETPSRERDVRNLTVLHELTREAGLLRKHKQKLLLTKRGRRLLAHPEEIPPQLSPLLIRGDAFEREVAELAFVILLAHPESSDHELLGAVDEVVAQSWRDGDGAPVSEFVISIVVGDALAPLRALGTLGDRPWTRDDQHFNARPCNRALLVGALRHHALGGPIP